MPAALHFKQKGRARQDDFSALIPDKTSVEGYQLRHERQKVYAARRGSGRDHDQPKLYWVKPIYRGKEEERGW